MRLGRGIALVTVLAALGGGGYFAYTNFLVPAEGGPAGSPSTTAGPGEPGKSPSPDAEPTLAWGPTVAQWEDALATAAELSVQEAAGQVLVMSWNSPDASGAAAAVENYHLGGIIVMGDAVVDANQVSNLTGAAQAAASGRSWPLMVAVDQEGGPVARLDGVVPTIPGYMAAGAVADKQAVSEAFRYVAADLRHLGFNVDYAPVADVTVGLADPTIRVRSAGDGVANVAATVVATVDGFVAGGVVPTVKHFPGHGSVETDSHHALPAQSLTLAQLAERDFVPFGAAVDAGAPSIMMGHIVVPEWSPLPASVVPQAYEYLRTELGFTGVIVTDAINMRAVSDIYGPGEAAVAAIAAGADVVLMPADVAAAHNAIVVSVETGTLSRERLNEAAARSILMMRWQESLAPTARDTTEEYAFTFALAGTTVTTPECGSPIVSSPVHITGGFEGERDALAGFLLQYGITTGRGGDTVQLLGAADRSGSADVVVAMNGPWGLASSQATTYIGLYGRDHTALAALAAVLAGAREPGGVWPVELGLAPTCAER